MNRVILSPEYFPNPTIGRPIANADIYVGIVDLDPTVLANQKQISVQQENGTIVTVAQPISTGAGGVPLYLGSPVTILVDGDYSINVLDKQGAQVYYIPSQPYLASDVNNPDNFGASPSATAAVNDVAFQAAFDAGGYVSVSPGTYLLSTQLTVSETAFNLTGSGIAQSVLKWESGSLSTGILITESDDSYFVNVCGFSLVTEQAGIGDALKIVRSGEESGGIVQNRNNPRVSISDIYTAGATSQGLDGWRRGVYLTDCMHCTIDRHHNVGYMPTPAVPTTLAGIHLDGAYSPVEIVINDCWCLASIYSVFSDGTVEGIFVDNCIFVNNTHGVWHETTGTGEPQLLVTNCHISSHLTCVRMQKINQSMIRGNLFYHRVDSIDNGAAMWSTDGTYNIFEGNTIVKTSDAGFNFTGILLDGTETASVVNGNTFQIATTAISLGVSSVSIQRRLNKFVGVVTQVIDQGSNTIPPGHRSILALSSPVVIPDSTTTEIIWDTEVVDELGGFTAPSTDFVAQIGTSWVDVDFGCVWVSNSTGERRISIYKNGALLARSGEDVRQASGTSSAHITAISVNMLEGDTLSAAVYQSSGGNLSVSQTVSTFLRVVTRDREF